MGSLPENKTELLAVSFSLSRENKVFCPSPASVEEESSLVESEKKKRIETLVENIRMFFRVYGLVICRPTIAAIPG